MGITCSAPGISGGGVVENKLPESSGGNKNHICSFNLVSVPGEVSCLVQGVNVRIPAVNSPRVVPILILRKSPRLGIDDHANYANYLALEHYCMILPMT